MRKKKKYLKEIATFLEINPEYYDYSKVNKKINKSFIPKNKTIFRIVQKTYHYFSKTDAKFLLKLLRKINLHKYFLKVMESDQSPPKLSRKDKAWLYEKYKEEIESLETLIEKDLSVWKP